MSERWAWQVGALGYEVFEVGGPVVAVCPQSAIAEQIVERHNGTLYPVPAALLVTRAEQEESDDAVSTLRSDARYLRGLALDAPTEEDADALRKIAGKLDALAAVVLPEEGER